MKIGDAVVYVDPFKVEHAALLTNVFDGGDAEKFPTPAVNLAYVSGNEAEGDGYGRQLKRCSSLGHISGNTAQANCWKKVGE